MVWLSKWFGGLWQGVAERADPLGSAWGRVTVILVVISAAMGPTASDLSIGSGIRVIGRLLRKKTTNNAP
jgi:hypothetical protein